jgi:hypothetical protein
MIDVGPRCLAVLTVVGVVAGAPHARAGGRETAGLSLGFGYVSPLADPAVSEGYGGGASLFVRFVDWFGGRFSVDVTHSDMEGDLSALPFPYLSGDFTFGPVAELTGERSPVAVRLSFETGAYWSAYAIGTVWTWGLNFGSAVLWRMVDFLGLQLETRYHLYNLAALGEDEVLCPQTLQPSPVLDRFDLVLSFVVAI